MGYNVSDIKKKTGAPALSMAAEILERKDKIFKNHQWKGQEFELIRAAYAELRKANNLPKPSTTLCRSACIKQMNKMLGNWIKIYDREGMKQGDKIVQVEAEVTTTLSEVINQNLGDDLVPVGERMQILMEWDWIELKEYALEKLGEEKYKSLNGKKPPSKASIVEALLGL